MRTRSTAPSAKKAEPDQQQQQQSSTPKTLTPAERPSKTFILPSTASEDARFVTLPNPQTGALNRYFFCPKQGVYEFTVVASQQPRSILFTSKPGNAPDNEGNASPVKGSIAKTAELLIATPVDIIFFMIPLLAPSTPTQAKKLFQPLDDIIDSQDELPKHLHYILYNERFRKMLQARAEAVCDTVEAGDEKMFRFSETKFLMELIAKAERIVAQGLPASLEERFIRQTLVTPMMTVKRENPTTPASGDTEGEEKQGTQSTTPGASNSDSTTTSTTTPSGESGESTPATEPVPDEQPSTSNSITHLLRLSTALSLMKESYIPDPLCTRLDEILASPESPIDLKPLQDRLQHIAALRAEALAMRSLGDFSRKRGADDIDAAEVRAEKKQREEEDKKKQKAGQSRGVKDLQKVNTNGMKKMSDFFKKS